MKKSTLLLCCCWLLALGRAAAQSAPPSDSVRLYLDHMFANVDQTQVPAPYLEEYGFRFAPLRLFTGTLQDSNRTTAPLWRQLYGSVLSGHINGSCALPLLPDLNAALQSQVAAGPAIPVLVQRLSYATLRPDAIAAGLLTGQNDQLFDVAGRTESPYAVRTLFAAAPARNTAATGDVSFVFTQALHVQSGGGSLRGISLDFGDGRGYLAITWGQPLAASYTTAGTKRVKVRITYNNLFPSAKFATYESHFDLEVLAPATNSGTARYTVDGFDQIFPPVMGVHSGALVSVRFGGALGGRTQITKPLIVAEGYDPSSIAPEVQDNISIQDFLDDIRVTGGFNLYNALEDQFGQNGYDIIFIDYNNGTDDIRRNAALFEQVVRWVNNQKVIDPAINARQRNVVLGISMGGLVARYGLAEMEKRGNDPTDTRLLLTHDSPHRGSNTPLGVQALIRQAAGSLAGQTIRIYNNGIPRYFPKLALFPALQQADDLLDAPATRQLLLVRATRQFVGGLSQFGHEYNTFVDGEYRTMITPNAGQTFPYEFKATSLGSQCAVGLFAPHSELVRIEGKGYVSVFLASTGLHTEIIVNALPNGGRVERLSRLRIWQETQVLIFRTKIYLTRYDYYSPASNPVAWDGLPGGTQRINGQLPITPGSNTMIWWQFPAPLYGFSYNVGLANSFCLVPTASALDVPQFDNVTTLASYFNSLTTGPSRPEPVSFIAQGAFNDPTTGQASNNFEHPRFPGRQAEWLFNEMQRQATGAANAVGCTTECVVPAEIGVSGPTTVCGTSTFTTPPRGAGYTYSWTASPASAFTVSSGTGPSFTTSNNGSGSGTVSVQIIGECPSTLTKGVTVGAPEYPNVLQLEPLDGCNNLAARFQIDNYRPDLFAYGVSTSGGLRTFGSLQADGSFVIKAGGAGGSIFVNATNACGTTTGQTDIILEGCGPYGYTLSPNPADDEVQVQEADAPTARSSGGIGAVRVYDGYGRLRLERPGHGARALRLPLADLPAGLYVVHIVRGNAVVSRQRLQITR